MSHESHDEAGGRAAPGVGSGRPEPRLRVVVSYYRDGSHYPRSGSARRRDADYWANIAVNAATLRHVAGPEPEFLVCAREGPPARAGRVLERAGAEVRRVAFDREPPADFYNRYVGSLYLFDVMAALEDEVADDDVLLFVDPDIVWARDPAPLVAEVRRGGVVAYELVVGPTLPLCDLTRQEQGRLLAEMTGRSVNGHAPTHFGGELYGLEGRLLRPLLADLAPLWEETMARYRRGQPHYHVEEHLMNAVLHAWGEHAGRGNAFLQRIITLPDPIGTRARADADLVAWHLPREKDRAFPRLLTALDRGATPPPVGAEYRRWLARRMGVSPAGGRAVADRLRRLKWAVEGRDRRDHPYLGV